MCILFVLFYSLKIWKSILLTENLEDVKGEQTDRRTDRQHNGQAEKVKTIVNKTLNRDE